MAKMGVSNTGDIQVLLNGAPIEGLIRATPYTLAPSGDIGEGVETLDGVAFMSMDGHRLQTLTLTVTQTSPSLKFLLAAANLNRGLQFTIIHGDETVVAIGVTKNAGQMAHENQRTFTYDLTPTIPQTGPVGTVFEV
jgi:hypothetical protein